MHSTPIDFGRRRMLAMVCMPPLCAAPSVWAQDDLAKPVRLIVSFPPGSGTDIAARFCARRLQEITNQTFVVENRPGANSFVAAQAVAQAPPDGTTLFFASNSPMVVNAVLFKNLPYDPVNDFASVAPGDSTARVLLRALSSRRGYHVAPRAVAGARARGPCRSWVAWNIGLPFSAGNP